MTDYFDRAGQPISEVDFTMKQASQDYKQVRWSGEANMRGWISTVWRGVRPGLFSTRVYPAGTEQRYETEAEALAGHQQMVEEESK
jgi:hypothetical protein